MEVIRPFVQDKRERKIERRNRHDKFVPIKQNNKQIDRYVSKYLYGQSVLLSYKIYKKYLND